MNRHDIVWVAWEEGVWKVGIFIFSRRKGKEERRWFSWDQTSILIDLYLLKW